MKKIEISDEVASWLMSKSDNKLIDIPSLLEMIMLKDKNIENQYVLTTFKAIPIDKWKDFGPSDGIGGYNGLISVNNKVYKWLQSMRKTENEQLCSVLERIRINNIE